jgi:archaellum component FlaF (FlaF/FlaG flagellin family)
MLIRLASLAAVIAALCAPAAHAAGPANVRMASCTPWQEETGGSVTYTARMGSVPGTARMLLRFRLFEKYGDGEFERVSGDGLGVWRRSRVGAEVLRHEHTVDGLRQGAVYRMVVHYRWRNADGQLIQRARRRSVSCSQGGGLPNLRVVSVETRPGEVEETAVYRVKVVNNGDATAQNVGVLLRVDGEVVDEAEVIKLLEPNETRTLRFNGPVCRNRMRIVADPKELISELRERDNVLSPTCL